MYDRYRSIHDPIKKSIILSIKSAKTNFAKYILQIFWQNIIRNFLP